MEDTVTSNGGGSGGRPPRLPRWTRQEILVLIQGKKVVESRGKGKVGSRIQQLGDRDGDGMSSSSCVMVGGTIPVEPKWASVSSYCRRHGVDRGPVQCRKRWSNLAGDYKKIKEWESKRTGETSGGESYWIMRNDLRRDRKLPGFFDREVYDILDGKVSGKEGQVLVVVDQKGREGNIKGVLVEKREKEDVFDNGRTAVDGGSSSDTEDDNKGEEERPPASIPAAVAVIPISERKLLSSSPLSSGQGRKKEKQSANEPEEGNKNKRRRRRADDEDEEEEEEDEEEETEGDTNQQTHFIKILSQNSKMLREQLQAQNLNSQLEREQRREQSNSVVDVLGKLADALGRIADKL